MSAPTPPATTTFWWCPVCGRDDRHQPFTGKSHHMQGKRCPGTPVKLRYRLAMYTDELQALQPGGGA